MNDVGSDALCTFCRKPLMTSGGELREFSYRGNGPLYTHFDCARAMAAVSMLGKEPGISRGKR